MGFGAAQKPVDPSRVTSADLADSEVSSIKNYSQITRILILKIAAQNF